MRTASGFRIACLTLALALLGAACSELPRRDADGNGVRGGTLLVLAAYPDIDLDPAESFAGPIAHTYLRTLYGHNLSGPLDQQIVPVPDIASGPPRISADQRTYTFTLRPGVRYDPTVNREVTAGDFITAIQRLYDKRDPSYWQQYSDLIAGAAAFGAGKASRISGLAAPDARTLTITLVKPAGDFLSILALPGFAPVPGEYAAGYAVGDNYGGHVAGTGPTP
jgi:peptide/nickel transport system substrate-binding protein